LFVKAVNVRHLSDLGSNPRGRKTGTVVN
jgi:hypothetical protein